MLGTLTESKIARVRITRKSKYARENCKQHSSYNLLLYIREIKRIKNSTPLFKMKKEKDVEYESYWYAENSSFKRAYFMLE